MYHTKRRLYAYRTQMYIDFVINFPILLPHIYGDINKLSLCFVELVFFILYLLTTFNSKLQQSPIYLKVFKVELYKIFQNLVISSQSA